MWVGCNKFKAETITTPSGNSCAKVGSSWWKLYGLFFVLFLGTRITHFEAVAVPKTDLIRVSFPPFGSIYLVYPKYIALTARSHRWRIVHQRKQTDTKETWMPDREKRKEKGYGVHYIGTIHKPWQLSFCRTSVWAKSGENQDIQNT